MMLRNALTPLRAPLGAPLRQSTRAAWTKAHQGWRADQSPTTSISASPSNGTRKPQYQYKFLSQPATTEIIGIPFR
jgi:hypothetical protein